MWLRSDVFTETPTPRSPLECPPARMASWIGLEGVMASSRRSVALLGSVPSQAHGGQRHSMAGRTHAMTAVSAIVRDRYSRTHSGGEG